MDWKFHKSGKLKSHLVDEAGASIVFRDGHRSYQTGCGLWIRIGGVSEPSEPNGDSSDPCRNCARSGGGVKFGRG